MKHPLHWSEQSSFECCHYGCIINRLVGCMYQQIDFTVLYLVIMLLLMLLLFYGHLMLLWMRAVYVMPHMLNLCMSCCGGFMMCMIMLFC